MLKITGDSNTIDKIMNQVDCWFLNLVVHFPVTLGLIQPYDQCIAVDPYFTPSNLKTSQIEDILYRLFQDEFLLAITPEDFDYFDQHTLINNLLTKAFIPSREQIKAGLTQEEFSSIRKDDDEYFKNNLYFFLTKKGGTYWEYWCQPKWNQFFLRCINSWDSVSKKFYNNSIPPRGSAISCAKSEIGEKIIAVEYLLEYPQPIIPQYIEDSAIWETFTPWHPTYWKTLSCGYAVSYQYELVEIDEKSYETEELTEEKKQAREWYKNTRNWYINPRI